MALRIGKKKDGAGDDWADAAATPDGDSPDPFAGNGTATKKGLPPAAMAGLVVLLLAVVGAGAYFFVLQPPAEDDTTTTPPPTQVATTPETPENPAPEAPADQPPAPAPATPAAKPKAPAAAKPKAPALPKPSLPKPTPTPGIPTGLTGQDGKGLEPGNTVPTVQVVTPALQAQLRQLWQQGAQAKWRGDYAGARRAWTRMLQLHPGHPGVQSAINKLPK